ncbi:MAG: glycosyltransferase family 4 protein, partial [Planctomycetota bacterium]
FTARRTREATGGEPLRLVFLGRLVPYKGCDMALAAAEPLLKSGRATFDVFGNGPEMAKLRAMTEGWPGVTLHGNVPHEQLSGRLAAMDLLVFPSIREFGGAVVLEAMAVGLPSLIVDYGGPGDLLTPHTGWAVPMSDRPGIINAVRRQLEAVDADRAAIDRKGAAGTERVASEFTWTAKASRTIESYRWVLGDATKPAWGEPGSSDDGS